MVEDRVKWVWKSNKWIVILLSYVLLTFVMPIILNRFGLLSDGSIHMPMPLVYLGCLIVFARKDRDPKWYRPYVNVIGYFLLMQLGGVAFGLTLEKLSIFPKFALLNGCMISSTLLLFDAMRHSTIFVKMQEASTGEEDPAMVKE